MGFFETIIGTKHAHLSCLGKIRLTARCVDCKVGIAARIRTIEGSAGRASHTLTRAFPSRAGHGLSKDRKYEETTEKDLDTTREDTSERLWTPTYDADAQAATIHGREAPREIQCSSRTRSWVRRIDVRFFGHHPTTLVLPSTKAGSHRHCTIPPCGVHCTGAEEFELALRFTVEVLALRSPSRLVPSRRAPPAAGGLLQNPYCRRCRHIPGAPSPSERAV
jgi:hypothetical protein